MMGKKLKDLESEPNYSAYLAAIKHVAKLWEVSEEVAHEHMLATTRFYEGDVEKCREHHEAALDAMKWVKEEWWKDVGSKE